VAYPKAPKQDSFVSAKSALRRTAPRAMAMEPEQMLFGKCRSIDFMRVAGRRSDDKFRRLARRL